MSQEICRFCLGNSNLSPIFVNIHNSEKYTTILELTTGLKVDPGDNLPQKICENCTESVNSALNFRNQCHRSHIKLLQLHYKPANSPIKNEAIYRHNLKKVELQDDLNQDDGRFTDIRIEIEFQRITDNDSAGSSTSVTQDGVTIDSVENKKESSDRKGEKTNKTKPMTRKEKRDMYLNLVDGDFDPNGPVKCKVCKKTLSKWACFINHAKLHLGLKYMCEYCAKSFISSSQLKRHCRSFHGMKRELQCKHCNYLALDSVQLVLHERRVHTGERPFVCDECGSSYYSRRCLVQHVETHRTIATVQCESCPMKFKSARHLARHRYSTHTKKRRKTRNDETL